MNRMFRILWDGRIQTKELIEYYTHRKVEMMQGVGYPLYLCGKHEGESGTYAYKWDTVVYDYNTNIFYAIKDYGDEW